MTKSRIPLRLGLTRTSSSPSTAYCDSRHLSLFFPYPPSLLSRRGRTLPGGWRRAAAAKVERNTRPSMDCVASWPSYAITTPPCPSSAPISSTPRQRKARTVGCGWGQKATCNDQLQRPDSGATGRSPPSPPSSPSASPRHQLCDQPPYCQESSLSPIVPRPSCTRAQAALPRSTAP